MKTIGSIVLCVLVHLSATPTTLATTATPENAAAFTSEGTPSPIAVPHSLRKNLKSFEPSAGLYLSNLDKYLIASDDTTKNADPWLFFMNENGEIEKAPVKIVGIEKMTDIESLSQGPDGPIFILSSQGLNKNGEVKKDRNLFLKTHLDKATLKVDGSVELRPLLLKALQSSHDPILKRMREKYEKHLDIESHFTRSGELYVGLKEPQVAPSQAVVLALGPIDDVLAGKVQATVRRTIDLRTTDGITNRLSDMAWKGEDLWLTSTSHEGTGHLWRVNEENPPTQDFNNLHPEGLVFKNDGSTLVFFDQGSEGDGLFLHLP